MVTKRTKTAGLCNVVNSGTKDRWHFDAKSMRLLGERYAEEMLNLLKAGNE